MAPSPAVAPVMGSWTGSPGRTSRGCVGYQRSAASDTRTGTESTFQNGQGARFSMSLSIPAHCSLSDVLASSFIILIKLPAISN